MEGPSSPRQDLLFRIVSNVRYTAIIATVFSVLGGLLMFIIGAKKTLDAVWLYFVEENPVSPYEEGTIDRAELAMVTLVESMDAFLLALVLIIFAVGVFNLFVRRATVLEPSEPLGWLRINSLERLKQVLMEVLMVILAVLFVRLALTYEGNVNWNLLILPGGILLLAGAVRLIGWSHAVSPEHAEPPPGPAAKQPSPGESSPGSDA